MNLKRILQAAAIAGVAMFMLVASASAGTITYNTNSAGTHFVPGVSLILNSSSGVAATLTFIPNVGSTTGLPSNVNFGDFLLVCPTCSTLAGGSGSFFNAFTFDLVINDTTDGAFGTFVGSSTGGAVFSDLSGLTINWAPLQIGPGGSFGSTYFQTSVFTGLAAPNSGTPPGDTTVQGFVSSTIVPEPATLSLIGGGLLGLGLLRRKFHQ